MAIDALVRLVRRDEATSRAERFKKAYPRSATSAESIHLLADFKLDEYRLIPSLRVYVIVSHLRHELEIWSREDAGAEWLRRVYAAGQARELHVPVRVVVDDLYRNPLPPR